MLINQSLVLSITIPTWNRASFLTETLRQLASELKYLDPLAIEILISDNASTDATQNVVEYWINEGLLLRYIKNEVNIGGDANVAQCFNLARGKYVLILGDDDVFVDGALKLLMELLYKNDFGVVCLRSYGFNDNFRREFPGGGGLPIVYSQVDDFFQRIGPLITLISVCVINKRYLPNINASVFCGSNLVQVNLVVRAAISAKYNIFFDRYMIACKRNNSGGYNFAEVFVGNFFRIMDVYQGSDFTARGMAKLESRMMLSYYPFYIYKSRICGDDIALVRDRLIYRSRFESRWEYEYILRPILHLPKPLAIAWGAVMIFVGRIAHGDMRRGVVFFVDKLKNIKLFSR